MSMPYYERFYVIAVCACLAAGVVTLAHADPMVATGNFVAVAIGIRLDARLRGRWWLVEDTSSGSWERRRTPS